MRQRSDLDLSGILGQYDLFRPSEEDRNAMRRVQEPDNGLRYEAPVRLGLGPVCWSTSTALVPLVRFCHDVNGYYQELGVDWRASRKELREAYQAKDGQQSARLTYVFKQLLNPETRKAYDEMSLGEVFLDDYTQDELKRRAHEEAGRRATFGKLDSPEEILNDWGYAVIPENAEGLDSVSASREDVPRRKARKPWGYSYYAWQTKNWFCDEALLQEWQGLLSSAAAERTDSSEVAIGLTSKAGLSDPPFIIEHVGDRPVIFFSTESEPSREVASRALSEFLSFSPVSVS